MGNEYRCDFRGCKKKLSNSEVHSIRISHGNTYLTFGVCEEHKAAVLRMLGFTELTNAGLEASGEGTNCNMNRIDMHMKETEVEKSEAVKKKYQDEIGYVKETVGTKEGAETTEGNEDTDKTEDTFDSTGCNEEEEVNHEVEDADKTENADDEISDKTHGETQDGKIKQGGQYNEFKRQFEEWQRKQREMLATLEPSRFDTEALIANKTIKVRKVTEKVLRENTVKGLVDYFVIGESLSHMASRLSIGVNVLRSIMQIYGIDIDGRPKPSKICMAKFCNEVNAQLDVIGAERKGKPDIVKGGTPKEAITRKPSTNTLSSNKTLSSNSWASSSESKASLGKTRESRTLRPESVFATRKDLLSTDPLDSWSKKVVEI